MTLFKKGLDGRTDDAIMYGWRIGHQTDSA